MKDAYAKGKIGEKHYKILIEKISEIKNSDEAFDKIYSSQRHASPYTAQGSPIKHQ